MPRSQAAACTGILDRQGDVAARRLVDDDGMGLSQ